MSDGKLDFIDETPDAEAVEEVTQAGEPETEAEEGTGVEVSPPETEVKEAPKTEAHVAPLTALLDEREKRQKAEREAEQLRNWKRQLEDQQKQAQQKAPDVFEDPQGFVQHTQSTFQRELLANRMQMSHFLAERDFGVETVNEAMAFFDANPQFSHQFVNHPSPYHAGIEFYKRQKALQEIGPDPDKWKESQLATLKEQLRQELMAEMQTPAPRRPPVSLSGQPAAGKGEPTAKGTAFDNAFPG